MSIMKEAFMREIGFLKWAKLSDVDVQDYPVEQVFLSPDIHSLHILWTDGEGLVQHEIVDYPYDDSVTVMEFLEDEIADDAWETWEDGMDVCRLMSDYGEVDSGSIQTISIIQLELSRVRLAKQSGLELVLF